MNAFNEGMIMHDKIESLGKGSRIQHGRHNNRIYLIKLDESDTELVLREMAVLASKKAYAKIFCKVPKHVAPLFMAEGYILEAFIPKFYNQKEDVFFVSKFLDANRLLNVEKQKLVELSGQLSAQSAKKHNGKKQAAEYKVRRLNQSDVEPIVRIYKEVFETYPFPIHDPQYILKTMSEDVQYFGAERNGELAALSSAEIDFKGKNAEMTDFATHFSHLGNNLSTLLLKAMEGEMKKQGISLLYTIARLNSFAMNRTFLKNDYQYSGTLIKNTNIAGNIESMNVYYKPM